MATCHPRQVFTAADPAELVALKAYLDDLGYTAGVTAAATRTEDGLTITIEYPSWTLVV